MQQDIDNLNVTSEDAAKTVVLDQSRVGRLSRMDALQGQAISKEMLRRRAIEKRNIIAALKRIDNDEYGYCVNCEEEIVVKRLELNPAVSLCITCAEKAE